jgi:hypothetical protein
MKTQVATAALIALSVFRGQRLPPQVSPFPIDGGGAAFLIKVTNTTSGPLTVLADGRCRMRLDGGAREADWGGSGGAHTAAPGESWQELVKLVPWPHAQGGRRPASPYADRATVWAYREVHADLTSGDHTIAFTCGGDWSDGLHFQWTKSHARRMPRRSLTRGTTPTRIRWFSPFGAAAR